MSKEEETGNKAADLRRKAEAKMAAMDLPDFSAPDAKALIHELRTHQIELEMQNEELRKSEIALTRARDSYADLYDFAPVGYVSINGKGFIKQANLTMADMLGADRRDLINRLFSGFVVAEDEDIYYLHRKKILDSERRQSTELRLKKADSTMFWARIEITVVRNEGLLMAVSDISARKQSEEESIKRFDELKRMNRLMVGRELKMEQLSKEIRRLKEELSEQNENMKARVADRADQA